MNPSRRRPARRPKSETNAVDPAIFDREHLHQYTNGDAGLEAELVTLFLGQFTPVRAQLDAASTAQDWKFAAHSLKGSARSIGAPVIATLAEQLEIMGFEGSKKTKKRTLDQLDAALAAFADEVKKTVS
jgi:HPt (histidine-containing phosphotransfer) domain-containing protein